MDNEPYRMITHDEACDMLMRDAEQDGFSAFREFRLPNGKIADLLIQDHRLLITIVEVKLEFKQTLIRNAQEKYRRFCHRLILAVPDLEAMRVITELGRPPEFEDDCKTGIVGIYRGGNSLFRPATTVEMYQDDLTRLSRMITRRLSAGEAETL